MCINATMLMGIFVILIVTTLSHQIQIPFVSGKTTVFTIDEVRQCPDQGSRAIVWEMKLNRQSRQQVVLQGNITMKVPLDDQVAGNIEVSERGNGGWIKQGFVFKLPHLCKDLMLVLRSGWINFWEKAGISPPITCPISKGNYSLKDFPTSEVFKHYPGMKQGTFKTNVVFLKKDTRLGCLEFIVHS
ncbi:uncharacterized protein LOC128997820 [Macrosteles quadrilineatus]|uniref:uncharacterized protein LOC128997820 n=1 Tax=Macrosteles quadrilineatus TaxID=74068 RepID=UPI0023E1EB3B|nr:uncharacterized protein LOC128997820 [Macrosteles quadrilineatus]